MTKKSDARKKRDQLAKRTGLPQHEFKRPEGTPEQKLQNTKALAQEVLGEGNSWESLMQQRNVNIQLFQQYQELSAALMDQTLQSYMPNLQYTANLAKSMDSDVTMLLGKANALYERHAGKTGEAQGDADWMAIINLYQDYASLIDDHQMLVVPVAHELTEILQAAANAHQADIRKHAEENSLLDKNVTSEVEFTEVPTGGETVSNG
jgi:hypothetical protein